MWKVILILLMIVSCSEPNDGITFTEFRPAFVTCSAASEILFRGTVKSYTREQDHHWRFYTEAGVLIVDNATCLIQLEPKT